MMHGEPQHVRHYRTMLRNVSIFDAVVVDGNTVESLSEIHGITKASIWAISRRLASYSLVMAKVVTLDEAKKTATQWKQDPSAAKEFSTRIKLHYENKLRIHV
jgi:hypothetical protein